MWIAIDYIDGTDAAQLVRERYPAGMPVELATTIVTAVASALDYAHNPKVAPGYDAVQGWPKDPNWAVPDAERVAKKMLDNVIP